MTLFLGTFLAGALAAWAITSAIRSYAVRRGLVDVPNERSSHVIPTPRGGGIAIVVVLLIAIAIATLAGALPIRHAIGIGGGALAVALIGWLDDAGRLKNTGVAVRAGVHLGASLWAVLWLGGFERLDLGTFTIGLSTLGVPLAVLAIAWTTNLYNFMDGIDGIAGVQALVAGLVMGVCLWLSAETGLSLVTLAIAGASSGFLLWNWSPARIFMGDVGSGVLGFSFAAVAIAAENTGAFPVVGSVILLGGFIFDATTTLIRRLFRGERVYEAHRAHAYQRLVVAGWSHARVSLFAGGLAVALGGLALLAWGAPSLRLLALAAASVILIAIYGYVEHLSPMTRRVPDRKIAT